MTTADQLVVTATPTIEDGYVVRWYANLNAAETGHEMMSASRNGVRIRCYFHEVPQEALNAATSIAARLKVAAERVFGGDHSADESARALATHHRRGFGRHSQLEPIAPGNVDRWVADHATAAAAIVDPIDDRLMP